MLETPHVIVGAAIAAKVGNPVLAIPLSLASHFILDMTPHWNPHLNTELKTYGKITKQSTAIVIGDVALAITSGVIISTLFPANANTILMCSLASVLPDVVEGPYFFLGVKNKLIKQWIAIQKSIQNDVDALPGLLIQLGTIMAALWWIFS